MSAPAHDFSRRLHWALDNARFQGGRGRTGALAARYAVSRQTARKWLGGLALPELARMIEMATELRVSFDWLATGRGEPGLRQVSEGPPPAYGPPLSEHETKLLYALRQLPPRQQQAVIDLVEGLAG
ncbi:hypothetical protein [Luteimonas sp. FCS-9]|uniref:hypothetical protein n=1 Tax=Luteimonas sp. FCS-9 TaxID=1547516 RepID=UPI00063ECE87|nr:hypothetical protein [Luteimonas sp. FCS-9]KLI99894.1 hypothetical protein WQ56_10885 [Luteimonas sp. FCS-9]